MPGRSCSLPSLIENPCSTVGTGYFVHVHTVTVMDILLYIVEV